MIVVSHSQFHPGFISLPGHHVALGGVGDGPLHRRQAHLGWVHGEPRLVLLEVLGQVLRGLDVDVAKLGIFWENWEDHSGKTGI